MWPPWLSLSSAAVWLTARVTKPASHLIGHLCYGCLAVGRLVSQQVSVQVSFAGVAFRTVHAGVWTNTTVRQHVLLQVKLPPETFSAFWTRVWFFS